MKKIILSTLLLTLFGVGFMGCSQPKQWDKQQREALREALNNYRQMIYLENLSNEEFLLFGDEVAADIEGAYPVYTTFISMPGATDTVDLFVTTTIVDQLNTDARNMRYIFPYDALVAQGVLPAGLSREQQHAFYKCFAGKVNTTYTSMGQFFNAILADTTTRAQLQQLQSQCATDLFEWVITAIDVTTETTN